MSLSAEYVRVMRKAIEAGEDATDDSATKRLARKLEKVLTLNGLPLVDPSLLPEGPNQLLGDYTLEVSNSPKP